MFTRPSTLWPIADRDFEPQSAQRAALVAGLEPAGDLRGRPSFAFGRGWSATAWNGSATSPTAYASNRSKTIFRSIVFSSDPPSRAGRTLVVSWTLLGGRSKLTSILISCWMTACGASPSGGGIDRDYLYFQRAAKCHSSPSDFGTRPLRRPKLRAFI